MINVLFSGNEYVFDGVLTCALSIFKRSDVRERGVHFYVLTMDVSHLKETYTPIQIALTRVHIALLIRFLDYSLTKSHLYLIKFFISILMLCSIAI